MSRYPRTCRNGHVITGPEGEYVRAAGGQCRECLRREWRDRQARRVASGQHAERIAREYRRKEDERDFESLERVTRPRPSCDMVGDMTFEPRRIPELDAERRLGVDRRFESRIRAITDHIGRGTYAGPEYRSGDERRESHE